MEKIQVPVWSDKDGQDDLVWYDATSGNKEDSIAEADIAKHHKTAGTYQLHQSGWKQSVYG